MRLKGKLIYSSIVSIAVLIASKFIAIIPCRTAPNVPNPIHKWELCSIDPDKTNILYSIKEYFGYRSEEHTSELQSHSFISYAVFCLKKKKKNRKTNKK